MSTNKLVEIIQGECLAEMRKFADESIDCILSDLPYGTTTCKWDTIIPLDKLWEEYKRIIKPKGAIILFGTEPFTSNLVLSNPKWFREKLTWVKHKPSNIGNAKFMHLKYSEDIIVFASGKCTYNPQMQPRTSDRVRQAQKGDSKQWRTNRGDTQEVSFGTKYAPRSWSAFNADWKYPSNVLSFPAVVSNSKEKVNHSTQKPVKLLEYLIKTYTNPGELVLDNCIGSGSTAVAAVHAGRRCIGIEVDELYCNMARTRVAEALEEVREKLKNEEYGKSETGIWQMDSL